MLLWRLTLLLLLMLATPALAAFPTTTAPTVSLETSFTTTHNIAVPACAAGKLYLIFSVIDDVAVVPTWPSGTNDSTVSLAVWASGSAARHEIRYRFANGSDAQINVTTNIARTSAHRVYCITGAHASTPPSVGTYTNTGSTLTPNPPSVTAPWGVDDNLYFAVAATGANTPPTLSTCPVGFATNCGAANYTSGTLATGYGAFTSATENPGGFTFTGTAAIFTVNTVVVRPAPAVLIPPTGFSMVSGNDWRQENGVATPVNGYAVDRWNTASGPNQQVALKLSAIPDEDWTFQVTFRLLDAGNRYRCMVWREPGSTGNDTLQLDRLENGVVTTLAGPINLGVDVQVDDELGADVTGNAITCNYKSAAAAWATLCSGGAWCRVASGTATTTPATSYIGMAAKEPTAVTSFSGTLSAVGSDGTPPSTPQACSATHTIQADTQLLLDCPPSTDNVGVIGYQDEACAGAGCTNFALIRETAATSWLAADLTPSTLYRFRRRASDGGNVSAYSTIFEGTTEAGPDTVPPSIPGNCFVTNITSESLTPTCDAATDNLQTIIFYEDEGCAGVGCTNFVVVNPLTTQTTWTDSELLSSTRYRYRRRAYDGANYSGYTPIFEATTLIPPGAPAAPSGFRLEP